MTIKKIKTRFDIWKKKNEIEKNIFNFINYFI
jgi:hypothetical protein